MLPPAHVGIVLDGKNLMAAKVRRRGRQWHLLGTLRVHASSRFPAHDSRRMQRFIKGVRKVTLSLPDDHFILRIFDPGPSITPAQLHSMGKKILAREVHGPLDDYHWDVLPLNRDDKKRALVFAMDQDRFDKILTIARRFHLGPCTLTVDSFAFYRLLEFENKEPTPTSAVGCLMWPSKRICFSVWQDKHPVVLDSLKLRDSLKDCSRASLVDCLKQRSIEQCPEVPLTHIYSLHPKGPADEPSPDPQAVPVECLSLTKLKNSDDRLTGGLKLAVGVALLGSDKEAFMPNFIPANHIYQEMRRKEVSWSNRLCVLASICLLYLAMQLMGQVQQIKGEIKKISNSNQTITPVVERLGKKIKDQEKLEALIQSKHIPPRILVLLSQSTAEGVYLSSLSTDYTGKIHFTGYAESMEKYYHFLEALTTQPSLEQFHLNDSVVQDPQTILFDIECRIRL